MKHYSIILLLSIISATSSFAQNDTSVVHRNIKVEKTYVPEIKEMKRPDIELKATEIERDQDDVVYSNFESFITPQSIFKQIPPTDLRTLRKRKPKNGFIQAGFGFPILWNAEVFYPIINKSTTSLVLDAKHDGYFTEKKFIDSDIGLALTHKIGRKNLLFADVKYLNQYYNYYGTHGMTTDSASFYNINDRILRGDSILPSTQTIHTVRAGIGMKNIYPKSKLHYEVAANYQYTYFNSNSLSENLIGLRGGVSGKLQNIHNISIFADVNAGIYSNPENLIPTQSTNNTVIGIYPSYSLKWNNLRLKAGAKVFVSFTDNETQITGSPDVHASYLYNDLLEVSMGFDGEYSINTLSKILRENRYFNPNQTIGTNTSTPFRFYAAANAKPVKGLLVNAFIDYSIINDQYYFVADHFNRLTDASSPSTSGTEMLNSNLFAAKVYNIGLLNVGFNTKYNHKEKYIAYLNFKYTKGFLENANEGAWFYPAFVAQAGGSVEAIDNLFLNLDFSYESTRNYILYDKQGNQQVYDLNMIYDLNFSAHYTILDRYTIFARVNNILGNIKSIRYSRWNGYEDIGCNVLFGINLSL